MMANKDRVPQWMLLLVIIQVCHPINVTDDTLRFLQKQPNVRKLIGPNMVNVTWDAEFPHEMNEFELCFNFSYRFIDSTNWKLEMLTNSYRIIILRLHPGFIALVSKALCQDNEIILDGNKTEFVYFSPQVYISNVSCKIYHIRSLKCTWEWREDAPEDTNCSFALRQKSRLLPCKQYIKKNGRNTGCQMKDVFKEGIYKIKIWFANNLTTFSKTFEANRIEVLNPPVNISVTSMNKTTKLKWLPPPSLNSLDSACFQYHIKIIEAKTERYFKNLKLNKQDYIFSDMDKDNRYWMQIRARTSDDCRESKYWGEWSQPLFIGKEKKVFPTWILAVVIAAGSVIAIVLVIYLCNRYVAILCLVSIPDPSEKVKLSLLLDVNSQHCISVHNEQPVAITEIEIVTSLLDHLEEHQNNV